MVQFDMRFCAGSSRGNRWTPGASDFTGEQRWSGSGTRVSCNLQPRRQFCFQLGSRSPSHSHPRGRLLTQPVAETLSHDCDLHLLRGCRPTSSPPPPPCLGAPDPSPTPRSRAPSAPPAGGHAPPLPPPDELAVERRGRRRRQEPRDAQGILPFLLSAVLGDPSVLISTVGEQFPRLIYRGPFISLWYCTMVCSVLEYGSFCNNPHTAHSQLIVLATPVTLMAQFSATRVLKWVL